MHPKSIDDDAPIIGRHGCAPECRPRLHVEVDANLVGRIEGLVVAAESRAR